MKYLLVIICGFNFITLSLIDVYAQTRSEIDKKYRKADNIYTVSENILMSPFYAADGQICKIVLYPKRVLGANFSSDPVLSKDEVKKVLGVIIPMNQRGAIVRVPGKLVWADFTINLEEDYSDVTIVFRRIAPQINESAQRKLNESKSSQKDETIDIDQQIERANMMDRTPTSPQWLDTALSMVFVHWKNRKCVGQ